jgi:hypothetical protein
MVNQSYNNNVITIVITIVMTIIYTYVFQCMQNFSLRLQTAFSGWEWQFWHESDSLLFMIFQILTPGRPSDGTKSLAPGIFWELGMRMLSTFPWGLRMAILLLCDTPQLPKVPQLPTTRVILCLVRPFGIYRGFGSTSKHFPEIDWGTWWRT